MHIPQAGQKTLPRRIDHFSTYRNGEFAGCRYASDTIANHKHALISEDFTSLGIEHIGMREHDAARYRMGQLESEFTGTRLRDLILNSTERWCGFFPAFRDHGHPGRE